MKTRFWKSIVIIIAALLVTHIQCDKLTEPEIGNITGTVTDSNTGRGLAEVTVSTEPVTVSVSTNSKGEFTISGISVGEYYVKYHDKDGYQDGKQRIYVQNRQSAEANFAMEPLQPPVIDALTAGSDRVKMGESIFITVKAHDPDGEQLSYSWSNTGGAFSSDEVTSVTWVAPQEPGTYKITVTVRDENGDTDRKSIEVQVIPETTISGMVFDAKTEKPISKASVWTEPNTEAVVTNEQGAYTIRTNIELGTRYRVTAWKDKYLLNYAFITVREGKNKLADIQLSPEQPQLSVYPDTLQFGKSEIVKSLIIRNLGTGTLHWSLPYPAVSWLRLDPLTGSTTNIAMSIQVTVNRTGQEARDYSAEIRVSSDGGDTTVVVFMNVPASLEQPVLQVSPLSLDFEENSVTKIVDISNVGTGTLLWWSKPTKDWVQVNPDSGSVTTKTMTIVVTVQRQGLLPGPHIARLEIRTAASAGSAPVPVTMTVPDTANPVLNVSETILEFGSETTNLQFNITNTGTGNLHWQATSDKNWINIDPSQGYIGTGVEPVAVTVDRKDLDQGVHTGDIVVTSNGGVIIIVSRLRVNTPPYVPTDPFPAHRRISVAMRPSFNWTGGDPDPGDLVVYDFHLGPAPDPARVQTGLNQTSYIPAKDLMPNTVYYWQVIARDNHKLATPSPIWQFTTGSQPNDPPNTPDKPFPSNGAEGQTTDSIQLKWECGDPDDDVLTYDVYFGTEVNPPRVKTNHSTASYEPGNLQYGTIYYWKVVAKDSHASTTTGPVWSFTTREPANNPPNTPANPSPADQARNISITPTLRWSGGDLDPNDVVTYSVFFGTSPNPSQKQSFYQSTSYTPGELNYSTNYYWKIVAQDDHGDETEGPVWRFTTRERPNTPPYVPSNPSPANGATNVLKTKTLSWRGGDPDKDYGDEVRYAVYFGKEDSLSLMMSDLSTTQHNPGTLVYAAKYHWQIIAKDTKGGETKGPVWHFTVESNQPPSLPSNPSPANNAQNVARSVTLSWSGTDPNNDPLKYDLYFGLDNANLPPVQRNLSTPSYTLSGTLQYSATYYWKIVAKDNYGNVKEGPVWHFTTGAADTQKPIVSITSPHDGATVRDKVQVKATASDNVRVTKVEFYLDHQLVSTDATAPYEYTWDTTKQTDGSQHTLMAKAYDAVGNVTGSAVVRVTVDQSTQYLEGKIAFLSIPSGSNSTSSADLELYVMNANGTERIKLTNSEFTPSFAWSPDGNKIAFAASTQTRRSDVYVANSDGTGQIRLTDSNNASDYTSADHPSWSPNGNRIAFLFYNENSGHNIWVVNADGTGQIALTNMGWVSTPFWSPDGNKIGFLHSRREIWVIWVMNADGTRQRKLIEKHDAHMLHWASWSPAGDKIVFSSSEDGWVTYVIDAISGVEITRFDGYEAAWSPDGSKIAFTATSFPHAWDIWVINANGTGMTNLTNYGGSSDGQACWSPDGNKIAFASLRGDIGWEIYVMNSDGTGLIRLNRRGMYPSWAR